MDLKQLSTFVSVYRLGSLSGASAELRIAQPALSRQIRMLEEELQVTLFERRRRGMVPTEAGERLLPRARVILQQVEETRLDLIDQSKTVHGSITIGMPPMVSDLLAGRLIERFHRSYPKVRLRIVPDFSGYLLGNLHRGELDLAVIYGVHDEKKLRIKQLLCERLFLVGPGDAGLSMSEAVAFADLADYPLILPGGPHGLSLLIARRAQDVGITLQVRIEADGLATRKELVERRLGYTILPMPAIEEEVAAGKLTAAGIVNPTVSRRLVLAQLAERPTTTAVRLFAAMLEDELLDARRVSAHEADEVL